MKTLQVGVVGLGARGQGLIGPVLLKMEDIQIAAVCDVYPDRVKNAADGIEKAGHPRPFETENYRDLADLSYRPATVIVSQRTSSIQHADKIVVLDRGRIVEEGTHEQLKNAGGIYQKIYETQSGSQEVTV